MKILIYVLDALRADHLGCMDYHRPTTPNIDAIAANGVLFQNCFSSSTWTRPVAASILTGAYPASHQTRTRHDAFSTKLPRLPEILKEAGYATAGFCTMGNISSHFGFDRGFAQYINLFEEPSVVEKRGKISVEEAGLLESTEDKLAIPRSEDINTFLLPWMEQHKDRDAFGFVWSIDPHAPYQAPISHRRFSTLDKQHYEGGSSKDLRSAGESDRQRLIDLYDDEILYNDDQIGKFVHHLKELDIYDETLLLILGDHGDAFYEHGVYAHGHMPYDELIHVPLIIKLPSNKHAGTKADELVELVDIFPTLMTIAGINSSSYNRSFIQGRDLTKLFNPEEDEWRSFVFSDTQLLDVHNRYFSVRSKGWKYIHIETPKRDVSSVMETVKYILRRKLFLDILLRPRHYLRNFLRSTNHFLFDLENDPHEQTNLAGIQKDKVQEMNEPLKDWIDQNEDIARDAGRLTYTYTESEHLRRHLEELGYL